MVHERLNQHQLPSAEGGAIEKGSQAARDLSPNDYALFSFRANGETMHGKVLRIVKRWKQRHNPTLIVHFAETNSQSSVGAGTKAKKINKLEFKHHLR